MKTIDHVPDLFALCLLGKCSPLPLDTLITFSVHSLENVSHSLSSFVWEFCNVLSLSHPLFFPHSALHLCIILCGNTIQVLSLGR